MLNLPIAMLAYLVLLTYLFQDTNPTITFPQSGDELRGQIEIQGQMDIPAFASAELSFTFETTASDPAATWFPVQTFVQPFVGTTLTVWDTTQVTDGLYALRLRIYLQDGSIQDVFVRNLTLYNTEPTLVPLEQSTLADFNFQPLKATVPAQQAPQVNTPMPALRVTATPMPANPAALTRATILSMFGKSALLALIVFAFFALVIRLRKNN